MCHMYHVCYVIYVTAAKRTALWLMEHSASVHSTSVQGSKCWASITTPKMMWWWQIRHHCFGTVEPVINITTKANSLSSPPITTYPTLSFCLQCQACWHDGCWKQPQLPAPELPNQSGYTSTTTDANSANADLLTVAMKPRHYCKSYWVF